MAKVFTVKELILEMEKLILGEEFRESAISQIKTQASFWNEILNRRPVKNIVKKLDLSPNWFTRLWTLSICEILYIVFKIIWRLRIFGINNMPQKGAFLLCANHTSYLDGFIIAASMPRRLRKDLFFIGYRAYFEFPVCISGSYESWARTKLLSRPHPVKIIFGRPFSFQELKKERLRMGAGDDYEAIALGAREELIKLKGML